MTEDGGSRDAIKADIARSVTQVGLSIFQRSPKTNIPSRQDVEQCIAALQIEEEREKEALRTFYQRERSKPAHVGKALRWTIFILIVLGVVLYAVVMA